MTAVNFNYFEDTKINAIFEMDNVIVFDLNGLIVDDELLQLKATNAALRDFSIRLSESDWSECCIGHRPGEYIPALLTKARLRVTAALTEVIIRRKDHIYSSYIRNSLHNLIRPGVTDLIAYCEKKGLPVALASGTTKTGVETILGPDGLGIMAKFSYVICGDEVAQSKPDPEIYLKVRAAMGARKSFVALEDSYTGVEAAIEAGMRCIAVPNRFTLHHDLSRATLRIDSLQRDARII
ncbi:HAD family hydrolase [Methylocystis parvus]|uniref:HAD family phosphatase n=1 Tax=Methylocystis parvus TaxID=134 RepID=A0A6B8ME00_9HYPH|nr:HAD family phosphatase [Methylocystis parvus]QGM99972.1 HAD family phosphatase [Methylocystis parvus]WBK02203.1 HAD family phosphatase [Methylocystis parvus OBBP]